jgi:hypothetical protein
MSNKEAAEQCIEGGLDEGKHDPQEAIRLGLAGIGYALADIADAIREQTEALTGDDKRAILVERNQ